MSLWMELMWYSEILHLFQNKCRYGFRVSQTYIGLTGFIKNTTFVSPVKFIIKIDSMMYLMIVIVYYDY
jgi:hypothetical protein